MLRYGSLFLIFLFFYGTSRAQAVITAENAIELALNNQRNLKAANLTVQQQQQLLTGAAGLANPQVFGEATPYEPLIVGVQQSFSLPGVYRSNRALQNEQIRLARLQLLGSQYELKRDVRLQFLQLQYFAARERLLKYQDSVYLAIKTSSKRFFEAGQINKLEELQATTQADQIRNDLIRTQADLAAEKEIFRFYTAITDSFIVSPIETNVFIASGDTVISNIQQQILQQQVVIGEKSLQVTKASLLPQLQAGVSFPTTKEFETPIGYQFGVSIPIWRKQNRSQVAAARTGIEVARAQQELEQQRLKAQYRQATANYRREAQSLTYFTTTALPQANAIIETSQRLFQGGELNYIESLRNLQVAFEIFFSHLETHRSYNEAVIQLNYLNGTL